MENLYKRTKVIATLGPAITQKIWDFKTLENPKYAQMVAEVYKTTEEILKSGVNVVRLNFSHGSVEEHLVRVKIVRDVARKLNYPISIMLDTKGPEIRVAKLNSELVEIKMDSHVAIKTIGTGIGDKKQFYVSDSTQTYNMAEDVKVGEAVLVDDGKLVLDVQKVDIENGIIDTVARNTHSISENRRINLPNATYSIPFLSEKDRSDIILACEHKFDYIAASFTNTAQNVKQIRKILDENNGQNIQIISKIETTHAIKNIDEIIIASNGIMVARGDLGLEIEYYDVPYWEKYIIKACRFAGKPVIVATQMLDSLEKNIQPTRAEVTDVFFAVERGTDGTMLSGETAKGMFPVNAVKTMTAIDKKSELLFDYKRAMKYYFERTKLPRYTKLIAKKIAKKVLPYGDVIAPTFPYDFVVLFTNDKQTIWTTSNIRPAATIIVITDNKEMVTSFGLNYAIQIHHVGDLNAAQEDYINVSKIAISHFKSGKAIAFFSNKFHKVN